MHYLYMESWIISSGFLHCFGIYDQIWDIVIVIDGNLWHSLLLNKGISMMFWIVYLSCLRSSAWWVTYYWLETNMVDKTDQIFSFSEVHQLNSKSVGSSKEKKFCEIYMLWLKLKLTESPSGWQEFIDQMSWKTGSEKYFVPDYIPKIKGW